MTVQAASDRKVIGSCLRFNRIIAMASRKLSAHAATSRGGSKLNISFSPSFSFSVSFQCHPGKCFSSRLIRISISFPAEEHRYFVSYVLHSASINLSTHRMFKTFYFSGNFLPLFFETPRISS